MQTFINLTDEDFKSLYGVIVFGVITGQLLLSGFSVLLNMAIIEPIKQIIKRRHPRFAEDYRNR